MTINILPKMTEWIKDNLASSTITYFNDDPYGCQWTAASEDDRIYTKLTGDIAGKILQLQYGEFSSSDGKTWLLIRSYDSGGAYETVLSLTPVTTQIHVISVPETCAELRIYFRHDYMAAGDASATLTVRGVGLYPAASRQLEFHKVLPENLPETVLPGEERIYYTYNGLSARQYISTAAGDVIPVGSNTEYDNTYTQAWIDERMDDILTFMKKGRCIMFAVATDVHVRMEDGDTGRYNQLRDFIMLSKQLPIDYVCCLGDIMSYCQTWNGREPRAEKARDILNQIPCPWFITRGNHDHNDDDNDGSAYVQVFDKTTANDLCVTNADWYRSMTSRMTKPVNFEVVFDDAHPCANYFYVDDYAQKHRLIFADTEEVHEDALGRPWLGNGDEPDCFFGGIKTKHQVEWIANHAMDMSGKTDWTVTFLSHRIPYTDEDGVTEKEFHGYGGDNPNFRTLLKAFQNGISARVSFSLTDVKTHIKDTVVIEKDFTAQGPIAVTGYFGGHIHDDCYAKVDGMNYLVSTCTGALPAKNYWNDATPVKYAPERNDTDKAMSVNVVIINTDTRTVNVVKIGSKRDNADKTSSDYEFTY